MFWSQGLKVAVSSKHDDDDASDLVRHSNHFAVF